MVSNLFFNINKMQLNVSKWKNHKIQNQLSPTKMTFQNQMSNIRIRIAVMIHANLKFISSFKSITTAATNKDHLGKKKLGKNSHFLFNCICSSLLVQMDM